MKTGQITGLLAIVALVLALNLSGCGQKGPLYHESPVEPDAVEDPASDEQSDKHKADRPAAGSPAPR